MKWLVTLLLILASAIVFTLLALQDPGFVIIGRQSWTVETSLAILVILLVISGIIFYHLTRLITWLWTLPSRLASKRLAQQETKAAAALVEAVFTLLQGQLQAAEKIFLRARPNGNLAALHYLGAGYCAYQSHEPQRGNDYFNEVRLLTEEELALTLGEAKLQLQNQNLLSALKNLLQARTLAPKHPEVLLLLFTVYLQLADWSALLELLPELRKQKILSPEQIQHLENRATMALLPANPVLWSRLPKTTRLRPIILTAYVRHLIAAGEAATAEPLLRESLKHYWDAELVTLYGEIETPNTSQQLSYAESWLATHDQDPALLLTLGRLCWRNRLWGKAQQYLEASSHLAPTPLTYQILGELAMQMENIAQANEYYRRGLQLVTQRE